jgi:hypothetical protein
MRESIVRARAGRAELLRCLAASPAGASVLVDDVPLEDTAHWLTTLQGLTPAGVPGAGGVDLVELCWQTLREAGWSATASESVAAFQSVVSQFSADEVLLEPHSKYRLTVARRQHNPSIGNRSWSGNYHFQTSGPPGDYQVGDDLDTLKAYWKVSVPPQGATDVFGNYGVGVVFQQPYVNGMYDWPAESFDLRLFGPDGLPALDVNGNAIVLSNTWRTSATTSLRPWQAIMTGALGNNGCPVSLPTHRPDVVSTADIPAFALEPQSRYSVHVFAGASASPREVGEFHFTTGRYGDFTDLVGDARPLGAILVAPDSAASLLDSLVGAANYDAGAEEIAFQAVLLGLGLAPRPPAPRLQSNLVALGNDENAARRLLLLEFPQPVDFRRLELSLYEDPDSSAPMPAPGAALAAQLAVRRDGVPPLVLRSADGMRVLLSAPDHHDLSPSRRVSVSLRYTMAVLDPVLFPDEPQLIYGGRTEEVAAACFVYGVSH